VVVPLKSYNEFAMQQAGDMSLSHVVIAAFGLVGIWVGRRQLGRYMGRTQQIAGELRESEARYRSLVESSPEPVFVHAGGRFVYANPAGSGLLGIESPQQLVGQRFLDYVHPDDRESVAERVRRVVEGGESVALAQERFVRPDGSIVAIEATKAPIVFGGQPAVQVLARDVTEKLRVDEHLRQAQKMEAIGKLAGGIAHDFNNILTAMTMQLGVLRESACEPELAVGIEELDVSARRAAGLTRQLLMFGRQSVMQPAPVDMGALVEETLSMLRRLIGEQTDLRFHREASIPLVEADAGMLQQVLVNLVVNARDAMSGTGTISVSVGVAAFDGANREDGRGGTFVCLAVSDTGCGMDADTVRRAFEPFFTTKSEGRGTGLGLATVDGVVRQHRGWVDVQTAPGEGATFRVYLPACEGPCGSAAAGVGGASTAMPRAAGPSRILLVEDEDRVRRLAGRVLRSAGYEVFEAANGVEAIAEWKRLGGDVDLLFTDMVMPEGITGAQLADRLRAEKPSLRVVLTSGYSADIAQAGVPHQAGVSYLPKPYQALTLGAVVRECLQGPTSE
jgi:two-component system, cell cycle sensor histidine kinase and response regulator CckA